MTCSYCGTRNNETESRCRRCGRRADDTLTGEFTLQSAGALATQPVLRAHAVESVAAAAAPKPAQLSRAVQRPLFQDAPGAKVIPIAPPAPRTNPEAPARRSTRRGPRVPDEQGKLDFLTAASDAPRKLGTAVHSVIFCDDRPAAPTHRALAAALDLSMVLIGYGLFLGIILLCVGSVPLSRSSMIIAGAVLPLFGIVYGLTWTLAGAETAGMHWVGLRLTTFEGERPDRRERLFRFGGTCLSICTGLGLLWPLADEESLAWQDYISRTFPTPRSADSRIFYRR